MKYPGHILIQRFQPEAGEMARWVEHLPTSTGSRVWTPRTQGELHLGEHTPALLQWAGMEAGTGELEVHGPESMVYGQETISNKGKGKDQHPTFPLSSTSKPHSRTGDMHTQRCQTQ